MNSPNFSGLHCGRCGLFVFNGECDCIPEAASSATEVGAEPRERMGRVKRWETRLMSKETREALLCAIALIGALAGALACFKH